MYVCRSLYCNIYVCNPLYCNIYLCNPLYSNIYVCRAVYCNIYVCRYSNYVYISGMSLKSGSAAQRPASIQRGN